jgi:hypothetical protein
MAYTNSKTNWFTKFMTEPSLTRRLRTWSQRVKVEDKRSNRYLESVTNSETGEVIHHCSEPLSRHRGHGSAKGQWDSL